MLFQEKNRRKNKKIDIKKEKIKNQKNQKRKNQHLYNKIEHAKMKPLRNKGGNNLKKIIFFLILISTLTITTKLEVKAAEFNFYEAEYIDGIWMNKSQNKNIIYWQKARFFRKNPTAEFAYCIEPFSDFYPNRPYEQTLTPYNLSQEQIQKISLIAHFGYEYKNHTDTKWYAITQFMIWQIADPNADYYFTDGPNGNRITIYTEEMQEINNLVENYQKLPSFAEKTYSLVEDHELILQDNNNVLSEYNITSNNAKIENNQLIIEKQSEKNLIITLERKDNYYNKPIIFYQAINSQNLLETGDIKEKTTKLNIEIKKTSLTIKKVDKETKTDKARGEAKLEGARYQLYDENMQKVTKIYINYTHQAKIENLNYGKYYLKEIKAGEGYQVDDKLYEIEITDKENHIEITHENQVIKKRIRIEKLYGKENNWQKEANIMFNIYDKNNHLIQSIITNENGIAEIELPYGSYIIKQVTSTEGYQKIDDIDLKIEDTMPITYTLKDYKIPIPYTKKTKTDLINLLIQILEKLLWQKK